MNGKPTYEELQARIREFECEIDRLRSARDDLQRRASTLLEAEELALLGHWELDLVSDTLYWSDEIYRIFDLSVHEFSATYDAFLEMVHPQDRQFVDKAYTESVRDRTGYDIVHRLLLRDGKVKYVRERCKTEYDSAGKPRRSLGTVQDITDEMRPRHCFAGMIGRDPVMLETFELIRDLADLSVPVLIQGESGTGKELVARAIHSEGGRARQPFVAVNCSALPPGLLESELFGHVRGAFTGALRDKKGRFELADGGTLFLDEIADLPFELQAKLLRVLEQGCFERVGGERTVSVDVRLVSASNRELKSEVEGGRFRDDLFYRLNVMPIELPPLRERRNDIPLLVEHFIERAAREGQRCEGITKDALSALVDHGWPGNVRELRSAVQYALIKSRGGTIDVPHLSADLRAGLARAGALGDPTEAAERRRHGRARLTVAGVRDALAATGDNKKRAAELLGVGRATLYRFLNANRV
ncbi:MAG: sigma 54-interacting transcriptional regulator [Polyangia bacterium]